MALILPERELVERSYTTPAHISGHDEPSESTIKNKASPIGTVPDELLTHILYLTLPAASLCVCSEAQLNEYTTAGTPRRSFPEKSNVHILSGVCHAWRWLAADALKIHIRDLQNVQPIGHLHELRRSYAREHARASWTDKRIRLVRWYRRKLGRRPGAPGLYCKARLCSSGRGGDAGDRSVAVI